MRYSSSKKAILFESKGYVEVVGGGGSCRQRVQRRRCGHDECMSVSIPTHTCTYIYLHSRIHIHIHIDLYLRPYLGK